MMYLFSDTVPILLYTHTYVRGGNKHWRWFSNSETQHVHDDHTAPPTHRVQKQKACMNVSVYAIIKQHIMTKNVKMMKFSSDFFFALDVRGEMMCAAGLYGRHVRHPAYRISCDGNIMQDL